MRDPRLPPRPEPLPVIPPRLLTIPIVLPIFVNIGMTGFCMWLALYAARHDYNLSLFVQCLCVIANGWMLFRSFRGVIFLWLMWADLRRSYHGLWDELDDIALMHLQMLDGDIECPEQIDRKYQEFTDRFDARIREAFRAQKIPPIDMSKFKK